MLLVEPSQALPMRCFVRTNKNTWAPTMELNSQTGTPSPGPAADPLFGAKFARSPYETCSKLHFGGSTWVAPWPTPAKVAPPAQAPGASPFGGAPSAKLASFSVRHLQHS